MPKNNNKIERLEMKRIRNAIERAVQLHEIKQMSTQKLKSYLNKSFKKKTVGPTGRRFKTTIGTFGSLGDKSTHRAQEGQAV